MQRVARHRRQIVAIAGIGEFVEADDLLTGADQRADHGRTDEAGGTGDQDAQAALPCSNRSTRLASTGQALSRGWTIALSGATGQAMPKAGSSQRKPRSHSGT